MGDLTPERGETRSLFPIKEEICQKALEDIRTRGLPEVLQEEFAGGMPDPAVTDLVGRMTPTYPSSWEHCMNGALVVLRILRAHTGLPGLPSHADEIVIRSFLDDLHPGESVPDAQERQLRALEADQSVAPLAQALREITQYAFYRAEMLSGALAVVGMYKNLSSGHELAQKLGL